MPKRSTDWWYVPPALEKQMFLMGNDCRHLDTQEIGDLAGILATYHQRKHLVFSSGQNSRLFIDPSWGGWGGPERNLPSIISKSGSLQVRESTVVYWSSNKEHIIFIDFGQKMRRFLDGSLLFICTADGRSEQKQIQCLLSLPEGVKPRCCACSLNCG